MKGKCKGWSIKVFSVSPLSPKAVSSRCYKSGLNINTVFLLYLSLKTVYNEAS